MRSVKEIQKTFKHNLNRDLEIFTDFLNGESISDIAKKNRLSESYVKNTVIRRGWRATIFANNLLMTDFTETYNLDDIFKHKEELNSLAAKAKTHVGRA